MLAASAGPRFAAQIGVDEFVAQRKRGRIESRPSVRVEFDFLRVFVADRREGVKIVFVVDYITHRLYRRLLHHLHLVCDMVLVWFSLYAQFCRGKVLSANIKNIE